MAQMIDPRIGVLASGKFYAFANGYDRPEMCGTLHEVQSALGIPEPELSGVDADDGFFNVTIRFQYPAWDEVDGISYKVPARSKSEAISRARTMAFSDGHTGRGKGRYSFKAEAL